MYLDFNGLKEMDGYDRESAIESVVQDNAEELLDQEPLSSVIAETNCSAWEITVSLASVNIEDDECIGEFTFNATGEQDENMGYCGSSISGDGTIVIDSSGSYTFSIDSAGLEDY